MKHGWQTTEFWGVIAFNVANILEAVTGVVPPEVATALAAATAALYALSRGWAKSTSK